jgi:type IV fimbrial biogenesis protein FimU
MKKLTFGFTLIEVMVTVIIAAILMTVAVPSFTSLYESTRVNNNIEKIQGILAFARNQAITYGRTVNICSYSTATSCGTTTDWSKGIRVYIDIDGTETELRAIDSFNDSDKVKASPKTMTFTADGLSSGGNIIYCPRGKTDVSQSVSVTSSGRISYGTTGSSC